MTIKNIAIIAHVDHGKTTLVDAMLKQTHTFRDNQKEMSQTLLMDSNELEREKGITILSKNTAVYYKENKINIIDTPGHADFGSEVERVLNMASGALLLVDAVEGPLPQTRFVLQKALLAGLKIILFINKIDKKDARAIEVRREVENLFLDVVHDESSLNFTTLYGVGRDGKAFYELPENYTTDFPGDLSPLFETLTQEIENSHINEDKPFQMLISTLDYDPYVGRLAIGKVNRGILKKGEKISLISEEKNIGTYVATKLYTSAGLNRLEVDEVVSGDIVALSGISELLIGSTVTSPESPEALPTIKVAAPTIKITMGPNTSPFVGREGEFVTSRQIGSRLQKELMTNIGLKVEEAEGAKYIISGRGELHLAILVETMRREGFEMEVSKPQVIYKKVEGQLQEPFEELTIDVDEQYIGAVSEEIGKRKGTLINMHNISPGRTRIIYKISSRNLIGLRSILLTATRGTALFSSFMLGYEALGSHMDKLRNGALIASQAGSTLAEGLGQAQARGSLLFGPSVAVYEGMVVGISSTDKDLEINVCRGKKMSNNRSSGEGVKLVLDPPLELSLEQYLDIIADDEFLEVTPKSLRLRKKYLSLSQRRVEGRKSASAVNA